MENVSLRKYLILFFSRYKIYLVSLFCIGISGAVFGIIVDYKIKEIIDAIASNQTAELGYLLALFVFYKLMFHIVFFVDRLLDIKYSPLIIEQIIIEMYRKTIYHSMHWFDSHLSGEISNKISDFQNAVSTLINYFSRTLSLVAGIFITFYFLWSVNMLAALVVIIFVILYVPIVYWLLSKQMLLNKLSVGAKQEAIGVINDSVANVFAVKIIGNFSTEFKLKLKPAVIKWKGRYKEMLKFETYFVDNADTIIVVSMTSIQIYLLAYLYQIGQITAGGFTFIAMMTLKIHWQLDNFLDNLLFQINPNIAQMRSSYEFVNTPIDVQDKPDAYILRDVKGNIEYSNVNFSYGKNTKLVLSDFNLAIKHGTRIGIVGASGSGKTTLMKCLLRYFDVNSGEIAIDGNDIKDISQESLRNAISIIPQDITMFHRSVRDNLKLAKYNASDKEMIAACKKAKIHDDISQMPEAYDTIVGERGVKLSGGQRQRVAIARAILKNAPILILDEATSSLDILTERLIQDSLNELLENGKSTVIAIAHRLSTLKHMDRIIVLDHGKVVEEGTHNGLIRKKNGIYKKLWEMQVI